MTPLEIVRMYPLASVTANPDGTVTLHDPLRREGLADYVTAKQAELYAEITKQTNAHTGRK